MNKHYDRFYNRRMEVCKAEFYSFDDPKDYLSYESDSFGIFDTPEDYKHFQKFFNSDWSRYLGAHTISQAERDADYNKAIWESRFSDFEFGDEFASRAYRDSYLIYRYLYGSIDEQQNAGSIDELQIDEELPLVARFKAHHLRAERRKSTLKAKTRHIALGFPNLPDGCKKIIASKDNVYATVESAQCKIDWHQKARKTISNLSTMVNEFSPEQYSFIKDSLKSQLLSGPKLIVTDVIQAKGLMDVPVYEYFGVSQYANCFRQSRKGKSVIKFAKHYTGFSPKKGIFFRACPEKTTIKAHTGQNCVVTPKGCKKYWTQEEIRVAKFLEFLSTDFHQRDSMQRVHFVPSVKTACVHERPHRLHVTNPCLVFVPSPYIPYTKLFAR